jgi:hypothetical protein
VVVIDKVLQGGPHLINGKSETSLRFQKKVKVLRLASTLLALAISRPVGIHLRSSAQCAEPARALAGRERFEAFGLRFGGTDAPLGIHLGSASARSSDLSTTCTAVSRDSEVERQIWKWRALLRRSASICSVVPRRISLTLSRTSHHTVRIAQASPR